MFTENLKALVTRVVLTFVLIAGVFGIMPAHASSAVLYVDKDAIGAYDGTSWANAYTDLQSALSAASSGDEIWVAAGTYKPTTGTDRTISFELKNGVAVYGGFAGAETLRTQRDFETNLTVLSGDIGIADDNSDNSYHVVVGSDMDNTAVLDGFTIKAGNANGIDSNNSSGGGLYNINSNPSLSNLIISENSAGSGGGIYNEYRYDTNSLNLTNVTFKDNLVSGYGGGIFNNQGTVTITNGVFSGNTARAGGGVFNEFGGLVTIANNIFLTNTASDSGGGVYNYGAVTIAGSTFSENSVTGYGGGIYNSGVTTITNSTYFGNTTTGNGGGAYNAGTLTIVNSSFSGNVASSGGGILSFNTLNLYNTIIANSISGGDCLTYVGTTVYGKNNLIEGTDNACGLTNGVNGNIISSDPNLDTLENNGGYTQTMALGAGSPAIDAGDDANCPDTDQRGVTRPRGSHCDIGAYEYYQIFHVKRDADGENDGTSWADAYTDLQSALSAASSGDEIWVAAGTYKPTSGSDRTVSFELKNGVVIYGGFAGTETFRTQRDSAANLTVLSGDIGIPDDNSDNSYHVVVGSDTDDGAILDGFTVTAGNANGTYPYDVGGGIFNTNSNPVLANLTFSYNTANGGGGMYNKDSNPTLTNITFENNTADVGGGMSNDNSSPTLSKIMFNNNSATSTAGGLNNAISSNPNLTEVTFINNTAITYGGAMANNNSAPNLIDVAFKNNFADYGGGMHNTYSSPALMGVTFDGNSADAYGGGMNNQVASSPNLTNVTFTANTDSGGGAGAGAIFNSSSSLTLTNVTISNNASVFAGGIYSTGSSNVTIMNSILWGNTGEEIIHEGGSYSSITNSIIQGGYVGGTNIIITDPLLGPLQDNGGFTQTMALGASSPAIDAGADANCPDTDQRGVTHPQGLHCDIGAYEFDSFVKSTIKSIGAQDGWILESSETSNQGSTPNTTATLLYVGDNAQDKQYRSFLSFDTSSLPEGAVITNVQLKIRVQGSVGGNMFVPVKTHGNLLMDIRNPYFGTNANLAVADFQSAASKNNVGVLPYIPTIGWYTVTLKDTAIPFINLEGTTQFRLRFQTDDNNDNGADYLKIFSGNAPVASRPQLIIEYYVP